MPNSDSDAQPPNPKSAYEEAGQNYRLFCLWREKIIGGYVAILGALGIGFHQSEGHCGFQSALLSAAILVSFVFWLFNRRNSEFISTCMESACEFESDNKGVYSHLKKLKNDNLTHGLAVNVLVSGVAASCAIKIWLDRSCWYRGEYLRPVLVLLLIFIALIRLEKYSSKPKELTARKTK